eukprot:gnl/MRDRNA2_/MRDRNA2_17872_c0_seq1.p1 gnl/MRDRNA2_/MRDRNA2_17872_c0~~gnl/MRDRNA2_/MRDRNA2_17872_c0_seq1.p1  ORF type:complete len:335 (+),score=78.88 gnl/MRDRNA2_/MRDRNA2_17872_c0_seq1:90-1094(+)
MRSLKDLQADFKGKDMEPGHSNGQNSGYHAAGYSAKVHSRSQWTSSNQKYSSRGYNGDWEGAQWSSRNVELRPNKEAHGSRKSKAHSQRGEAVILKPREDGMAMPGAENRDAGACLLRMLKGGGEDAGAMRFVNQSQQQIPPQHYSEEPEVKEKWWLQSAAPVGTPEICQLDDGRDCPALSIDALMAMRPRLHRDDPKPDCLPMTLALPREESSKEDQDASAGVDNENTGMASQDGNDEVFAMDEEEPGVLEPGRAMNLSGSRGFGKWFGQGRRGNGGTSGDADTVAPGTEGNMSTDAGSGRDESSDGDGEGYGNGPTDWLVDAVPNITAPIKS